MKKQTNKILERLTKVLLLIRSFLSGKFLKNAKNKDNIFYLFFLTFLGVLYIGNSFWVDSITRRSNSMERELKGLRFEYITTKAEWISISKPSVIANQLEGMGVKQSTSPPFKIQLIKKNN